MLLHPAIKLIPINTIKDRMDMSPSLLFFRSRLASICLEINYVLIHKLYI